MNKNPNLEKKAPVEPSKKISPGMSDSYMTHIVSTIESVESQAWRTTG